MDITRKRKENKALLLKYKADVIKELSKGRVSPNSKLFNGYLNRDVFGIIIDFIKKNLNEVYLLQYSKLDIRLDVDFKMVECTKCGLSMKINDYIKSYEVISSCSDYNLRFDNRATKATPNCGSQIGQCNLCVNCNKLKYVPRINMFYCENHARSVFYSKKYDLFCNFYKQCKGIDDFETIGNDKVLLEKLDKLSVEGVNSKNLELVRKRWFHNNPLPVYSYDEDNSWDSDDSGKHKYTYNSINGYIYESSPFSSPLIFYDNAVKKIKTED